MDILTKNIIEHINRMEVNTLMKITRDKLFISKKSISRSRDGRQYNQRMRKQSKKEQTMDLQ